MFCKSCGQKIDNDSAFCTFCGTKQSKELKPLDQTFSYPTEEQTRDDKDPIKVLKSKYDPIYEREEDAIIVGIFLLFMTLAFTFFGPLQFEDRKSLGGFKAITLVLSFILRIVITVWVTNIAKRQNREEYSWGLFAFFLPSIALLIIATRKKLFANIQIVSGLSSEQNSKMFSNKAQEFFKYNRFSESIRFAEKAVELDPKNELAIYLLNKGKVAITSLENPGSLTQTIFRETSENKTLKIILKNKQTIGANVYIDDLPAPDGIYFYKSNKYKLIIASGKVKEAFVMERMKNLIIEKTEERPIQRGDNVFLESGTLATSGKYSLGFMQPKMVVENGKFLFFE